MQDGETIKEHEVKSGGDGGQQQRAGEASARASSLNKEDVKQKLTVDTHSNSRVFEHKEFLKEMGLKDGDNSGLIEFVKTKLSENPVTVDNRGCIVIQLTTTGTVVISPEGRFSTLALVGNSYYFVSLMLSTPPQLELLRFGLYY